MPFNEQNSVEHFIVHQLAGVNLNTTQGGVVREEEVPYGDKVRWRYVQPELLLFKQFDIVTEQLKAQKGNLKQNILRGIFD